jgi:hypothetical protein
MVKGVIPTAKDEETAEKSLSCTFCGSGTWSTWEIVTEDCVVFACDRHHIEMSEAKIIKFERMKGKEAWEEIRGFRETAYQEKNQDYFDDSQDIEEYE